MTLPRPENPATSDVLAALASATDRLLRTIDDMPYAAFAEPSVLPGWSRAHVLAHLALNAKGLAGVLTTIGQPDPLPMYASAARRDADIDRLATEPPARIADRVAVGASMLAAHLGGGPNPEDALEAVGRAGSDTGPVARPSGTGMEGTDAADAGPDRDIVIPAFARAAAEAREDLAAWSVAGTFDRVPGGPTMQAAEIPFMRWREVEIHHADLDLGYRAADWPAEFTDYLLAVAAHDRDGQADMTLSVRGGRSIEIGAGGPTVHGSAADIAWWLIGRREGVGLTVTGAAALPTLGPWHRRP